MRYGELGIVGEIINSAAAADCILANARIRIEVGRASATSARLAITHSQAFIPACIGCRSIASLTETAAQADAYDRLLIIELRAAIPGRERENQAASKPAIILR